jgi:hypothetical protein
LTQFEFDESGSGVFGQTTLTFDQVHSSYSTAGLRLPVIRARDTHGNQYTATASINVLARDVIDTLLKSKWNGMKASLIAGDVENALVYFNVEQRARYRTLFNALGPQLSQVATGMQDIQLITLRENRAKYRLRRQEFYGGQAVTLTYYVYFVQNAVGLWSIDDF